MIKYFRNKPDKGVYDYAVWFAFNTNLRMGEIKGLKFSDFSDDYYEVCRQIVDVPTSSIDKDGNIVWGKKTESATYVKGNNSSGYRLLPITNDIKQIVEHMKVLYPDNEYLFMSNGGFLATCTFNRHLKSACETQKVKYRSSHTIRFTNSDKLFYEGSVSLNDMQAMMGHSSINMTQHYLNRHVTSTEGLIKAKECLSVG